ncbi:hypothetical protein GCM10009839_26410 [Catenulispora yoronensis]|uniref:Uncharacterized protein n=1 Tax=Catenulispora yoronensis TaxID=450799 RepID=A0ABP5FJR4_9ACTN
MVASTSESEAAANVPKASNIDRSNPAENDLPCARSTTTRTVPGSAAPTAASAAQNSGVCEFRFSGRFSVTVADSPSSTASIPADAACCVVFSQLITVSHGPGSGILTCRKARLPAGNLFRHREAPQWRGRQDLERRHGKGRGAHHAPRPSHTDWLPESSDEPSRPAHVTSVRRSSPCHASRRPGPAASHRIH